jgi:hypothetical protein
MAAFSTIAAAAVAGASIGTTAYQIKKSHDDAKIARDLASERKGAQADAIKAAQEKAAADDANAANRAQSDALRKKQRQSGPQFGGTILTSPLGVQGAPQIANKTLLGS